MCVCVCGRGRGHSESGSITPAVALLASLLFFRLWQRGPQDSCWSSLLCLLWSLRGATLPDMDQCPGQVLWGTSEAAGPVPHQERREPGMSLTQLLGRDGGTLAGDAGWEGSKNWTEVLDGQRAVSEPPAHPALPGWAGNIAPPSFPGWKASSQVWCPAGLPSGHFPSPVGIPVGIP